MESKGWPGSQGCLATRFCLSLENKEFKSNPVCKRSGLGGSGGSKCFRLQSDDKSCEYDKASFQKLSAGEHGSSETKKGATDDENKGFDKSLAQPILLNG